jgi:hypothetical protein
MTLARLALTIACTAVVLRAQTPPIPNSPERLSASVVVRLPAGKATFHVGEEIPLELEFRGIGDKDYFFSTETCGRIGRLLTENFVVTPSDGIDDPLADFFSSTGFGGSCPGGWQALDGHPLVIRVALNDWVRFIRPGPYRFAVTSTRLQRYSSQPAPVLTSAPVDLTIVPIENAWAAAELIRASDLIDRATPADVRHGAAILRGLGTDAAAKALVERYDAIARLAGRLRLGSPRRSILP